jgi:recombination protein RecT
LLPDGREGAIVPFGDKDEDGGRASDAASWMPMMAGLRKKARNSGEISDWYVELVHQDDDFFYELGDEPRILHRPNLNGGGRKRQITYVYSIAKFKDGGLSRHVMPIQEVEDIRIRYARAKKGPWSDPIAYPEMVKKTCARQHAKMLPSSTDLDAVFRRDDHLYDLRERGKEVTQSQPRKIATMLEQFSGSKPTEDASPNMPDDPPADPWPSDDVMIEAASSAPSGAAAEAVASLINNALKHPPNNVEEFRLLAHAMIELAGAEADAIDLIKIWWASPAARGMRNKAGMTSEDTAAIAAEIKSALGGPAEQNK